MSDRPEQPPEPKQPDLDEGLAELDGPDGDLEVSEEEAALARALAESLDGRPRAAGREFTAEDDLDLATAALLKTSDPFALRPVRQAALRAEILEQFEEQQTKRAASRPKRSRWQWLWLPVPLAAAAAVAIMISGTSTEPMASSPPSPAAAERAAKSAARRAPAAEEPPALLPRAAPSAGLLRAQAAALASVGRDDDHEARRALDREVAGYRSQMIASLEVKFR